MTRRSRHLRTRLLVAMVAIAVGVLVFTGVTTLALARRSATDAALDDVRESSREIATQVERLGRELESRQGQGPVLREFIAITLRLSRAGVVTIEPGGTVVPGFGRLTPAAESPATRPEILDLPDGVDVDDLDVDALRDGRTRSGQLDDIVFVSEPLRPIPNVGTPVVVVTEEVDTSPAGRAGPLFVVVGLVAVGVSALVASFLARRLTRPIAAMQSTATRIAAGDLSARVHPRHAEGDDELSDLARALDGMAADLEAARGLERAFLLSVSHDLRTPLTSIRGYAEAIAEGALEGDEERRRAAAIIGAEAQRLERLVADLLDLARLDAHQFSLTPRPVDARDVVGEAVEAFRPQADDLGIALDLTATGPVPADADPERLGQVVANLVENALKYAETRVTVAVAVADGLLRLRVDDDGPGIDPVDAPHVFERLYSSRTVPGRKVGTGLGLAIVRELAVRMGGAATVERVDGVATRFTVAIPARPVARSPSG